MHNLARFGIVRAYLRVSKFTRVPFPIHAQQPSESGGGGDRTTKCALLGGRFAEVAILSTAGSFTAGGAVVDAAAHSRIHRAGVCLRLASEC